MAVRAFTEAGGGVGGRFQMNHKPFCVQDHLSPTRLLAHLMRMGSPTRGGGVWGG